MRSLHITWSKRYEKGMLGQDEPVIWLFLAFRAESVVISRHKSGSDPIMRLSATVSCSSGMFAQLGGSEPAPQQPLTQCNHRAGVVRKNRLRRLAADQIIVQPELFQVAGRVVS